MQITDSQVEQLRDGLQKIKFEKILAESERSYTEYIETCKERLNSLHNSRHFGREVVKCI